MLLGSCIQHAAITVTSAVVIPSYQYASGRFSMSKSRILSMSAAFSAMELQRLGQPAPEDLLVKLLLLFVQPLVDLPIRGQGMLEPDRRPDHLRSISPCLLDVALHRVPPLGRSLRVAGAGLGAIAAPLAPGKSCLIEPPIQPEQEHHKAHKEHNHHSPHSSLPSKSLNRYSAAC